jgi:hypothetical protein
MGAKSSRSKKLDADPPPVQMVLSYRLAATFGGDPVSGEPRGGARGAAGRMAVRWRIGEASAK